jgi:hypothetical protein
MGRGYGYNELGALNDIIMVYPTTRCWDKEGDEDFNTKDGIIPKALMAMINRVTSSDPNDAAVCTEYDAKISGALDSIESIRKYLKGETSEFTSYDDSLVPAEPPSECSPTNTAAEVKEQKIDLIDTDDFKEHLFDTFFSV